jgi:hypothetical protein
MSILLAAAAATGSTAFEDMCYAAWNGQPDHVASSRLIRLVAQAASNGGSLAAPSDADAEWLVHSLRELGFEGPSQDGVMGAHEDRISDLIKQQNRARQRIHADADTKRRRLLASSLDEMEQSDVSRGELGAAREVLRRLGAHGISSPAVAPVLGGLGAFLSAQSTADSESHVWICSREALLNGGDELVPAFTSALSALRLRSRTSVESGDCGDVTFSVGQRVWLRPELAALAALCTRYSRRCVCATSPTGSVELTAGAFEEANVEGIARLRCMISALLFRVLG